MRLTRLAGCAGKLPTLRAASQSDRCKDERGRSSCFDRPRVVVPAGDAHLREEPPHFGQVELRRLCRLSGTATDRTGTTTGASESDEPPNEHIDGAKTTDADHMGASSRAGDRGRTGDVQLGKLSRPLWGKGFSATVAE